MTQQHPITPPPELVQQWASESLATQSLCNRAAQWGADQELEACCKWLDENLPGYDACEGSLHAARRPKPPNLKRVALLRLDTLNADLGLEGRGVDLSQIRRAIEALPE